MGAHSGPNIVNDGLVLALDANNSHKTNFNISNLLSPYPWTVGTGSETFYSRNGTDAENERVVDTNPFDDTDIVGRHLVMMLLLTLTVDGTLQTLTLILLRLIGLVYGLEKRPQ